MKRAFIGAMLIELVAPVLGAYWIDWDGSDWPEAAAYTRSWGNWQGPHQGGANRTLENGVLTYDSLYDPGVYDYYYMERPGQMDPGAGELLVMEWVLKVDIVEGSGDPVAGFFSDDGWAFAFEYAEDHVRSVFENYVSIPIAPGLWHEYEVDSWDMRTYDLCIDGELARQGTLEQVFTQSYVGFGDGVQGAASLHHWDSFRFGVIPEPSGFHLLVWVMAWRGARRGALAHAHWQRAAGGM
jgi:hypothetical protein